MRTLLAAFVCLASAAPSAQSTDALAPLQFLVGDWTAVATAPGERGAFAFRFDVQRHVLVRTNEAVYDATPAHPASRHDDLMVVYAENGSVKADYFDSEGHVIRYTARVEPNRVVFVSDPDPHGPRFRLSYTLGANRVLNGTFEIAMPDAPEAFKPYLAWTAVAR
ncbi:MAG TPA: hypothetical protein VFA27_06570 [Vicinamibacterales bacterium]|nr:hypothetical protein [Vicinamibacterales bacterium]